MRKIKMMTSAVLLSLSLAFSLTACGTKSEPAADTTAAEAEVTETEGEAETAEEAANDEEEKVKVGVSWNADRPSFPYEHTFPKNSAIFSYP